MDSTKSAILVDDLRKFADFVEEYWADLPDVEVEAASHVWGFNNEDVPEVIVDAVRSGLHAGATISKQYSDTYFRAYFKFGALEYKVVCDRDEVCTAKVVGTETVTKRVPPEGEWTEEEVEQDVVEWDCHPLLAQPKEVTA